MSCGVAFTSMCIKSEHQPHELGYYISSAVELQSMDRRFVCGFATLCLACWLAIPPGGVRFTVRNRSLPSIVEMSKKATKQQPAAKRGVQAQVRSDDEASASQQEDETFGTPQPSRRQSAQAPSCSSRENDLPPRQKQRTFSQCAGCQAKPQADAKNWSKTGVDARGKTVAEGHLCFRCGDYCAGLDLTIDDFTTSCANQKLKPFVLKNVADFAAGKAQPELREFPLERVFAETRFTSTMEELFFLHIIPICT